MVIVIIIIFIVITTIIVVVYDLRRVHREVKVVSGQPLPGVLVLNCLLL